MAIPESPAPEETTPKVFDQEYVTTLRNENKEWRLKLQALETSANEREEDELKEQDKWQALAEKRKTAVDELTPYKEKYEAVLAAMEQRNTARVEALPDGMKSLVPDYDDPTKLSTWLDANAETLGVQAIAPALNGGTGESRQRVTKQTTLTSLQLEMAEAMGVTPEEYAAAI